MSSSNQIQMTILYVTTTGHIVGGVTRTDSSGALPKVADLVGSGLASPEHPNFQAASALAIAKFIIPPSDLSTVDVGFDQVGTYPWGEAIVQNAAAGATVKINNSLAAYVPPRESGPATLLTAPTASASPTANKTQVSVTLNNRIGSKYYIATAQPAGITTPFTPVSGAITSSPVAFSLPNLPHGTYTVLILVETMLPYLASFTL